MIQTPEVNHTVLSAEDRMLVICSDGVWEFLNNNEVMNLVTPFYAKGQPELACEKLVSESVRWWKKEDEVVDDITAIVLFFNEWFLFLHFI